MDAEGELSSIPKTQGESMVDKQRKNKEKPDHPIFSSVSIFALIKAIEKEQPNFGIMFAMFLGVPTLTIIKINEKYQDKCKESAQMGELYFRNWYNNRKQSAKVLEIYRDIFGALTALGKPVYGEIMQQRFVDELPLKNEDFAILAGE